jgi:hypothetical protein
MATDTATKQNDNKPAESPKAATPANTATSAKPAASTRANARSKPRAKTAAKSRTSRTRTAAKSRRKPAARAARTDTTAAAPRAEALNGGRQVFAGVIDAQEKALTTIADYQTRAAELSQIPGATAIVSTQAQLLRNATDVYVSTARALLK